MVLCQAFGNIVEKFISNKHTERFTDSSPSVATIIAVVLYVLLVLFVGKWLWNETLCKVVAVVKPMPSLLHFIGLLLLLDILHPGCQC